MASRLLASIVRKGGNKLLDLGMERLFPNTAPIRSKTPMPKPSIVKPSLTRAAAGAALTRIATRSVPGAIVVGGAVLARTLYNRRRQRRGKDGNGDKDGNGGA